MKHTVGALALLSVLISGHVFAQEICRQFPEPIPARSATGDNKKNSPEPDRTVSSDGKSRFDPNFSFYIMRGVGDEPKLIFVGDSLTQGVGATSKEKSYPKETIDGFERPRSFVVYAAGGKSSTAIADVFEKQNISKSDIGIIWVGRNNIDQRDGIVADVKRISEKFASKRVIILSVLKGLWMSEQNGVKSGTIDQVNNALRAAFPGAVVDVRSALGCDDYIDNIHLNDSGYAKVGALVQYEISRRGW